MPKRIAITGAAGFIGFHTARHFLTRGDAVFGMDNYNDYYDPALKKRRCEALGIEIPSLDLADKEALHTFFDQTRPTHILHLAAQAGVRYSLQNPKAYIESNLVGFFHVLEWCRMHPEVPLIFASSSSIYGLNQKTPFREDDQTDSPASLYGATKKCDELLASSYHHLYNIPMTALRFFTVYGPWGRPDMAYYSFAEKILAKEPLPVFGKGELKRDFTYIDDIVAGIAAALDASYPYEIFNLGSHYPYSVLDLIACLEDALQEKAIVDFQPIQKGDVATTNADIEKSRRMLGFEPKIKLSDGIAHFTDWFLLDFKKSCHLIS